MKMKQKPLKLKLQARTRRRRRTTQDEKTKTQTTAKNPHQTNQVCHGIDRSTVNWDLVVMDPTTDEDKTNNAKYAISVARKLGACVFVAAEDIVQVMSRMIMLFCASLWHCENERTAAPPAAEGTGPAPFPAPAVLETPQVCVCVYGRGL